MACASDKVIQSAAEGIGQSEVLAAVLDGAPGFDGFAGPLEVSPPPVAAGTAVSAPSDEDPAPEDEPFSDEAVPPSEALSSPLPWEEPDLTAVRRSRLAQPEPLKWTVGAEIAFLTGPLPHSGQLVGGSAWTPWITSKRRPQAAQS
jgi:hypothetical protein